MVMAQHCRCRRCAFDFFSGHSHHLGYSCALCTACLSEFALPTQSAWGPRPGELIVLHKLLRTFDVYHKKKPPRVHIHLEPTEEFLIAERAGEWGAYYPTAHLVCPCCQREGTIVLDLDGAQPCPKCSEGSLECWQIDY